ncbi:hypothetical protein SHI21_13855 [Bacteriovorax sp. PP10]|uniref:DUF5666 domain-containing protein n=1 Tax=Bacteriovorax antarcticus TaxID=3088717 RepID=A0ABU5VZ55_9BACT|nr:hypothetical protein [Bacteriovorax sp. PP10]MEA9357305.1 hypothetical protein [Bacteriovorax sp. PP10]
MKRLIPIFSILLILITLNACSHDESRVPVSAPTHEALGSETAEANGTVRHMLTNPTGKVEGFIMSDGTQVMCPPNMSEQVMKTISPNDRVSVQGVRENDRVLRASKITNTSTNRFVDIAATPPASEPAVPMRKDIRPPRTAGMKPLTAKGTVRSQIFGKAGELNGVVLSDKSIIHFGPRVLEKSKAQFDIGKSVKASGYGTSGSYGKSLEATSISNY